MWTQKRQGGVCGSTRRKKGASGKIVCESLSYMNKQVPCIVQVIYGKYAWHNSCHCINVELKVSFALWLHELEQENLKLQGFDPAPKLWMQRTHVRLRMASHHLCAISILSGNQSFVNEICGTDGGHLILALTLDYIFSIKRYIITINGHTHKKEEERNILYH